jgi:tetratricopeptide (TPR) repeat protein
MAVAGTSLDPEDAAGRESPMPARRSLGNLSAVGAGFLFWAAVCAVDLAAAEASFTPAEVRRRTAAYESAGKVFREQRQDVAVVVEFARTCFDRAEALPEGPAKASVAEEGIAACRSALERSPANAALHYYLGMNLGQLAQTRTFGALKLVRQMEVAWSTARTLDETLDHAGPDRSLGILFGECPRPPLSIGSRDKARRHLARAVELDPIHPENRLHFAEQLVRWGDREAARQQLAALDELLPAAKTRLVGPDWDAAWLSWENRLRLLRERLSSRR